MDRGRQKEARDDRHSQTGRNSADEADMEDEYFLGGGRKGEEDEVGRCGACSEETPPCLGQGAGSTPYSLNVSLSNSPGGCQEKKRDCSAWSLERYARVR